MRFVCLGLWGLCSLLVAHAAPATFSPRSSIVSPENDPFYRPPSGWEENALGTILRSREIVPALLTVDEVRVGAVSEAPPAIVNDLQPGDIVAYYSGASHVAIYAGNGMIIDALNSGIPVGERPLNMMPVYSAFRFY